MRPPNRIVRYSRRQAVGLALLLGAGLAAGRPRSVDDGLADRDPATGEPGVPDIAARAPHAPDLAAFDPWLQPGVGRFRTAWGDVGRPASEFEEPTGLAVGPDVRVYVADSRNHRVQVFTDAGVFLGQWGGHSAGPGQFAAVSGIAIDEQGAIYVADGAIGRVQKFERRGRWPVVADTPPPAPPTPLPAPPGTPGPTGPLPFMPPTDR